MLVNITDEEHPEAERIHYKGKIIPFNQDTEISQPEYMALMNKVYDVDNLPRRKYDITVVSMVDTAPEPTEEEKANTEKEAAYIKNIAVEFEALDVIFSQVIDTMHRKHAALTTEPFIPSTEAAMQAATAVYINSKK